MTTTRDRTDPAARGEAPDRLRWHTLAVTQLAAFMVLLDVSIVNVALPSIERGLSVPAATAQWVVSGYALTLGLALVPAGRLGDVVGRRRMFLIALTAFTVTSAITGAAPTAGLLIAARLVQGVAGGLLIPQNTGLVQELFSGAERGRAFGFLGGTIGLATAAGPVIGGLILGAVAARTPGAGSSTSTCRSASSRWCWRPGSCPPGRAPGGVTCTWTWSARCCSAAVCSPC